MKYRIALTLFILIPGHVHHFFKLVLNEMGPGRTSLARYFHTHGPIMHVYVFIEKLECAVDGTPSQIPTLSKFNIWPFDPIPGSPVWPKRENFTCILFYWQSPSIWYATWPCPEKLNFWPRWQNVNSVWLCLLSCICENTNKACYKNLWNWL